uniref:Uncharacterized protein n=1 Tax=Haptolina brevifila TaxID=156173 RepID=A0A7S2BQS4_9EUKA
MTNFIKIHVDKQLVIHQYDVKFLTRTGGEVKSEEGRQEILLDKGLDLLALLGGNTSGWSYDGRTILYTSSALKLPTAGTEEGETAWAMDRDSFVGSAFPGTKRAVEVTLLPNATLSFEDFGKVTDRACAAKLFAALDVSFRQYSKLTFTSMGAAFYDERRQRAWASSRPIGQNQMFEMWMGKRHSIVQTATGPMLQIDRACTVMLAPLDLVEFVAKTTRTSANNLNLESCAKADRELQKAVKNGKVWKIMAKHSNRTYKLRGIDYKRADESMFTLDTKDSEGTVISSRSCSVFDYFKEQYGDKVKLTRPDLPCVLVGKAKDPAEIRLPMEICKFVSCQPAPVSPELQAEQITATAAPPNERFSSILKIFSDLKRDQAADGPDRTVNSFGMTMGDNLMQAKAVILNSPTLVYRDASGAETCVNVETQRGQWNLRAPRGGDLGFIQPAAVEGRAFAVVKFEPRCVESNIIKFIDMLTRMAKQRGMDLGRQVGPILDGSRHTRSGADVEQFLEREISRLSVGLVICIIGDKNSINAKEIYPAIKRWSHTKASIPTQCVQSNKATVNPKTASSPQYHAGVLLKLNLKLGGANLYSPASHGGLALLRQAPTMVMGFDVNHPQPGSPKPSYSALVATMDVECSKYYTVVGAQKSRMEVVERGEIIVGFADKVRQCLRQFKKANDVPPARILFYRDGVAHNQFEAVKAVEVEQIFQACREEGGDGYVPMLTFIVVQQRTPARFAIQQGQSFQQVTAGTVINEDIVGADGKDWYMVAQHGLKGTARPSHFHIIHDDVPETVANPKLLQKLTFDFCHLYARATKIVSRPAPVYYAHRAAFLAQYYKDDYKEENMMETGSTVSTGSVGSNSSSVHEINLGMKIAQTVYFA